MLTPTPFAGVAVPALQILLFAHTLFIIGPVYDDTHDPQKALNVRAGCFAECMPSSCGDFTCVRVRV